MKRRDFMVLVCGAIVRPTIGQHGSEQISEPTGTSGKISVEIVRGYIKWIADQTGWSVADVPPIKTVSSSELNKMLFGSSNEVAPVQPGALYSKNEHLIFLASTWRKDDVLDQSILLHELVHHLQMENHVQFECWGRYEAQAYELQIRWLSTQGIEDPYKFLHASKASIETLSECP
jgi:hypothetical protein